MQWNFLTEAVPTIGEEFKKICKLGDVKLVNDEILKQKLTKQSCESYQYFLDSGLCGACRGGYLKLVHLLISKGAEDWNSALVDACYGGHLEIVHLLISKGANGANSWDSGLVGACHSGHLEIAQLMISKGADDWNSGLVSACEAGHLDLAQLMIANGAEDQVDHVLGSACLGGNLDIVRLLISRREPDSDQVWYLGLLYDACFGGHIPVVQFIISKIEIEEPEELTGDWNHGLEGACYGNHLSLVELMISKTGNRTRWHLVHAYAREHNYPHLYKLMISKGVDISQYYQWPLHDQEILELLYRGPYFGISVAYFSNIPGYQGLVSLIAEIKNTILKAKVMLPDLLTIVSKCIIV